MMERLVSFCEKSSENLSFCIVYGKGTYTIMIHAKPPFWDMVTIAESESKDFCSAINSAILQAESAIKDESHLKRRDSIRLVNRDEQ